MATSRKAVQKYNAKTYKRVPLDIRKEDYEILKAACERLGMPVNTFIRYAINDRLRALQAEEQKMAEIGFTMAEQAEQAEE